MKTLLKLTTGVALMVLAAACQKEKASTAVETPKEKVSLTELVQKMYTPSDASGDAVLNAAYASLSAEELQQFEILRLQYDSAQLTKKAAESSNGKVSPSQQLSISAELRMIKDMRSSVYTAALSKFNKPFNKLSRKEQDEVFIFLEKESSTPITTLACTVETYPSSATFTQTSGIGYYASYDKTAQGSSDCDYEYAFDGWYDYATGGNSQSRQCLSSFGDRVSRRIYYYHDGVDTFLLLGKARVLFFCHHRNGILLQMR